MRWVDSGCWARAFELHRSSTSRLRDTAEVRYVGRSFLTTRELSHDCTVPLITALL
jgi:hypothetical protein